MTKHLSIKTVTVSLFVIFLATFGCFQYASAASIRNDSGSGTSSTASTTLVNTGISATVGVTDADSVLVVTSYTGEMGGGTDSRDVTYRITDNSATPNVSGIIQRTLDRVDGNDKGIGSLVYIFDTSLLSGDITYTLQHSTSDATRGITTTGTIVAIPLVVDGTSISLPNASAQMTGPVDALDDIFNEVTGTQTSAVTTTAPGDFYVAASIQSDKTGGGANDNMGEWKLQYCSNGTCVADSDWNDLGYTASREISSTSDNGIINMTAVLPAQAVGSTVRFRLAHREDTSRSTGAGTIRTLNTSLVAVHTGFTDGTAQYFPIYEAYAPSSSTSVSTLPYPEAVGFDLTPTANTDLFMHAQYWMEATAQNTPVFDLFVDNGIFDGQDQQRLIANATDTGSGGSVGLAKSLSAATTYRVSLRHAVNPAGPTLTTNNPTLIMWELGTESLTADLSVTKACEDLAPGEDDALVYTITVSNSASSDTSPVIDLSDTIPAGVPAGSDLTDVKYVVGDTIPPATGISWPGSIALESIPPGSSQTVRIYADVPSDLTGIGENTATVSSTAFDSDISDNSASCTNEVLPSVTINQAGTQADPTNGSPINFTVEFSESVTGFGDVASDVTLGGTAPGTLTGTVTGTGTTYNVAVTGMTGNGTITATIPAGAAQDVSTNDNIASTSTDNEVTYDLTVPTVTIDQDAGQADPTNGSPINFAVVFSEPVFGFAATDVTLGGTAPGPLAVALSGSGAIYNVAVTGMSGSGTVTATIAASVAQDAAGNSNTASTSTDNEVTYDITTPIPIVTDDPDDTTVCDGLDASFFATASDAASIQWQERTGSGGTWGNIPGANSETLTFTAALSQNGYQYQAVFTNVAGTATSTFATLTVNAVPADPTSASASDTSICLGESTDLSANVGAGDTVNWYTGSGSCGDTPVGTGSPLTVFPETDMTYYARAANADCESDNCVSVDVTILPGDTITLTSGEGTDDQTLYSYLEEPTLTDITYVVVTDGTTDPVVTGLPAGLNVDYTAGAIISGSPTQYGTFHYTVTTPGTCPATATGTISVLRAPSINDRKALEFDGDDDYVYISDDSNIDPSASGTIEAWIYPTSFSPGAGIVFKGTVTNGVSYGFKLGENVASEQNVAFVLGNTGGTDYSVTATDKTLEAFQWYHIACVWDNTSSSITIYINGIAYNTGSFASGNIRGNSDELRFGMQQVEDAYFQGVIDEVRFWSIARAEADIRASMCKKIAESEISSDLAGYWRFDETNSLIVGDWAGNGNIGFIENATRICSQAPIGDDSAYDYTGTTATDFEINANPPLPPSTIPFITSTYGDFINIEGDGGTWDQNDDSCLHVYRVDGPPNYTTASILWKPFNDSLHYWGVFKAGGIDPTYTMVYHYDGYPDITNENNLQIAFRNHNCDQWKGSNATLDTDANTLILTGLSGTEFILGADVDPRNTINYDGTNDYVGVSDETSLRLTTDGSLEAWVYLSAAQAGGIIYKVDANPDGYSLSVNASGNVLFSLYESTGPSSTTVTSATTLNIAIWYHIAATWDGTDMNLYINGVLDSNNQASTQAAGDTTGTDLTIASDTTNYFNGRIDEVRIWDEARSEADIRTYMCQKIDTRNPNLVGYWRFDEETTSPSSFDFGTTPYNTATMYGFGTVPPTTGTNYGVITGRVCSEAPIGDNSAYSYGSTASATVTHPDGDYMLATANGGTWGNSFSGLHVYQVDGVPVYPPHITGPLPYDPYITPNGLTPPYYFATPASNWSSIDYTRYWGVFLTDWTTASQPTYDVIYHYGTVGNGNPNVPDEADPSDPNDPQIGLAKRDAYCDTTWEDSGANWAFGTNQLELLGANSQAQSQNGPPKTNPEYILGGINQPLAISLASFTAAVADGCIDIFWETATEVDTVGFQLWRSESKNGVYELVPYSYTRSKSVTETRGAAYAFLDCSVALDGTTDYYYKLEEIDTDNAKDNPFYGPIGPVKETVSASQGNTGKASSGSSCFIGTLQ